MSEWLVRLFIRDGELTTLGVIFAFLTGFGEAALFCGFVWVVVHFARKYW